MVIFNENILLFPSKKLMKNKNQQISMIPAGLVF